MGGGRPRPALRDGSDLVAVRGREHRRRPGRPRGRDPVLTATVGGAPTGHEGHEGHGGGTPDPAAQGTDTGPDTGLDEAVGAARAAGIDSPRISVVLPAEGKGYVVKETDTQFPLELDSVALDPADGKVLDRLAFADYPLLAKLTRIGIDAHTGVFLGLFNQLLLAALALALVLLVLWGYRMWWLRRPGRPAARGAWRKVPVTLLLPLAAATALVAWFVPLLGISLLLFLAVDAPRPHREGEDEGEVENRPNRPIRACTCSRPAARSGSCGGARRPACGAAGPRGRRPCARRRRARSPTPS